MEEREEEEEEEVEEEGAEHETPKLLGARGKHMYMYCTCIYTCICVHTTGYMY